MLHLRDLAALGAAAFALGSSSSGQVVTNWYASSGSTPTESATLWRGATALGNCNDATATITGGQLVLDNSSACADDRVAYLYTSGTDDQSEYWVEGECRVVQSAQSSPDAAVCGIGVARSQTCGWHLYIDVGEIRLDWFNIEMATLAMDTTTTSHTYRVVQQSGTNLGSLWIDGQLVLSSLLPGPNPCAFGPAIWSHTVWFGNADPAEGGITEWARVSHNIGARFRGFCGGVSTPNSTGGYGFLTALGSSTVMSNDLVLRATGLPPMTFGMLVGSAAVSSVPVVGPGQQGNLCLAGSVGRFDGPGQIVQASAAGSAQVALDLTRIPTANGTYSIQPGDSWAFQLWYRDSNPFATSNLTGGIAVLFD